MCGICGIFDFRGAPVDRDLLQRMTDRLQHRGPDGQGHFVCSNVGLGNRRLSIIDLEGGWQPQTNEDGKIQVVFNGEIYNFIELRNELIRKGHKFKTRSDTEVIAHAYEEWGDDCLRRFNGIFSFALWNASRQTLLLARDHLGVKPLYYVLLGNRLLFASEIKSLLVDAECPREVDIQALGQLFTLRYVPSPATIFKGIRKLPPAHKMIIDTTGVRIERFWAWTPNIRPTVDEPELIEQYQALVEDAVRLQMRSDVPVGLFLSSGIDSGSLLAIMSRFSTKPIRTFTIGFEEGEESNETKDALDLATMFESDHSEMVIGSQDYEKYYARYLWDIEEPVGNETAAAFYFVSLITSRQVKVALTGQGADEPWGGYNRYLGVKFSELYSRLPEVLTKGLLSKLGDRWVRKEKWKRGLTSLYEKNVLTRLINVYSFFSPAMKSRLFQPWIKEIISSNGVEAARALQHWQADVQDLDALTQALYIDTRTNLPDDLLMVGDKTSMANSLELRVPFLDYRLVEFIETLPGNLKIRGLTGKYLHKKAVEKWLPKEVVYRKKKGFANPVNKWLRTCMHPFVNEHLLSEKAAVNYYFNRDFIRETIEKNERRQQNYMRHIYLLLSFELWHRQFISA